MIKTRTSLVYISVFLAFLYTGYDVIGQEYTGENEEEEKLENRFIIGGDFGMQFGTITLINVSPMFGYRITKNFTAGLGFMYQYYRYKDHPYYNYDDDYKTNIYGGSIFARYYVWNDLFAHLEYQLLNYEPLAEDKPVNVNSYLIGAGYRQWISNNFAAVIMVLFNLNETMYSPYSNPIIRIGFQGGL